MSHDLDLSGSYDSITEEGSLCLHSYLSFFQSLSLTYMRLLLSYYIYCDDCNVSTQLPVCLRRKALLLISEVTLFQAWLIQ